MTNQKPINLKVPGTDKVCQVAISRTTRPYELTLSGEGINSSDIESVIQGLYEDVILDPSDTGSIWHVYGKVDRIFQGTRLHRSFDGVEDLEKCLRDSSIAVKSWLHQNLPGVYDAFETLSSYTAGKQQG